MSKVDKTMVVSLLLNDGDNFQHIQTFHYEKRRGPAVFGLMCRWQMFYTIFFQHTICPIFVANWTTSSADMALKFRLGISDKNMRIGVGWR